MQHKHSDVPLNKDDDRAANLTGGARAKIFVFVITFVFTHDLHNWINARMP